MTELDNELRALLIEELRKHLDWLEKETMDLEGLRQVLHAVKGTAGVAGELALSESFCRLERKDRLGDAKAPAIEALKKAIANLEAGQSAYQDTWPIPPLGLSSSKRTPSLAARYEADMAERMIALDALLANPSDPQDTLSHVLRHLHAMKGAAAAVGDDAMSWFCHGLESLLDPLRGTHAANALEQLTQWRPVLRGLVHDPAETLTLLRGASGSDPAPESTNPPPHPSTRPEDQDWLHVPAQTLDLILERMRRVSLTAREVDTQLEAARKTARTLRTARQQLLESRRMIGPPRPWGAPMAALDGIENATQVVGFAASQLESATASARRGARRIGQNAVASRNEIGTVRRATMSLVFERVDRALHAMAERSEAHIHVKQIGAVTPVDRRLAEALVDPVLQLARNAFAHGIESPSLRLGIGKPKWGTIVLSAEIRGAHLVLGVRDDGAGVDIDGLRSDAIRSGRLAADAAWQVTDDALLNLLFLPGVTTRTTADLLAGRGLGLNVSLHAARKLGGTIRIRNRPGRGLLVLIDVPLIERGQVRVLWVRSLGNRFALTARHVLRIRALDPGETPPLALATWIDPVLQASDNRYVIELGRSSSDLIASVSVSAIEGFEEATVRPVPPLVAVAGPYVGVIVGADGHPSLLIDALIVLDHVTRSQGTRASSYPPPAQSDPSQGSHWKADS